MKRQTLLVVITLLVLGGISIAQIPTGNIERNPERRGIRRLKDDEIRRLSGPRTALESRKAGFPLDVRKSIFVTDVAILKSFTLEELMEKLVKDDASHSQTRESLFEQWWDTANPKTTFNLPFGGPNCDSGLLNNFPYKCPRDEGQQVLSGALGTATPVAYTAIALSNRFDLATPPSKGGRDCGEYRIVFERNSGAQNAFDRNLIIFEAVLPNPSPSQNSLHGCRKIQDFWEKLSNPGFSVATRATLLHDFYYKGLPGYEPVVKATHYGSATSKATGQIRTNQFMAGSGNHGPWLLREFHIQFVGQGSKKVEKIIPVPVATNPPASLFDETDQNPLGTAFRAAIIGQVNSLADGDINKISMETAIADDDGESEEGGLGAPPPAMDYSAAFAKSPNFANVIKQKLGASALTPVDIVSRAQTQSCAGCHHLSTGKNLGGNLTWPTTLGFTHEQLANPENGPDGLRYQISPALTDVFLPFRKHVMETFLH